MSFVSCDSDDDPEKTSIESFTVNFFPHRCVQLVGYVLGTADEAGFCYSTTNTDPTPENSTCLHTGFIYKDGNKDGKFCVGIDDMDPLTYYYRAYAKKDGDVILSNEVKQFTVPYNIETFEAKEVFHASARLEGRAEDSDLTVGFYYSEEKMPTRENAFSKEATLGQESFNGAYYRVYLYNLKKATTYYYRCFARKGDLDILSPEVRTFTTDDFVPGAVDLGLSVKWDNCNVGASSPEVYGTYFAWGETEGFNASIDGGKESFYTDNYKFMNNDCKLTKYYDRDHTVLEPEDDAATVNKGQPWRMPTYSEWSELRRECTWTLISNNGNQGYKVVGPNGNYIFLPAAGCFAHSDLIDSGWHGFYWSSTVGRDYTQAYCTEFNLGWQGGYTNCRIFGLSVRAVCE